MIDAPIGYSTVHLGLNNQKLALLGLCERAMMAKRPIVVPRLSLFDPTKTEHATVPLEQIFNVADFRRYCDAFDIGIADTDSPDNETGWGCFTVGSGSAARHARRGLAALGDFVCQFFDHLVPLVVGTPEFRSLSDIIFDSMKIDTVIQLRIEKDWIEYSSRHLEQHAESGEEYVPTFQEIMAKVRNTPELRSRLAYVVCDEANLPVDKDEIRQEVKARFDITLVWKSDFLSALDLAKFSILELALIDFEMAMRAPWFVGLSRSSFSDLVTFEKFSRTRQPVRSHFIYNVRGDMLEGVMHFASGLRRA